MNNPFRNLVKKPARHEKGEIVVADSGNVKEVAKIMIGFEALLRETQSYMSKACGNKLFDSDLKDAMRQLIKQYMKDHNYYVPHMNLAEAADRLYVEMAEYSFLTPLLARKDIEEININSWDDIQIIPSKGQQYKYSEHFSSAQHAVDVVRRMLHNNKLVFDASRPLVTGYLDKNIRISAIHSLIVGDEVGVSVSIRIVNPCKITKQQFIESEMCTEEIYEFLAISFVHGISQVYAGATGSGKTTIMADIMSNYPNHKRLITLEKSVREFDLVKRDENGRVVNDVLHLVTKETDDPTKDVTLSKLLTMCLTMHPNAICVAEMKNDEAWQAQEAARTGHTVLTTTHAGSTEGIYRRLGTLCLQAYPAMSFSVILALVTEAFPIGIYMKQLDDGSRRIMEIAECIYKGGESYETRSLYRYDILSEERSEDGTVKIEGQFVKVNAPSESLMKRLRGNGVPKSKLELYGRVPA